MVREALEWVDEKMDEIDMDNDKHPMLKAFGLGAIEGFIDGAVIAYPFLVIGIWMSARKIQKIKR